MPHFLYDCMVLKLDCNSDHVAHAGMKRSVSGNFKIRFVTALKSWTHQIPRSGYPFYNIKWVTTSWTDSNRDWRLTLIVLRGRGANYALTNKKVNTTWLKDPPSTTIKDSFTPIRLGLIWIFLGVKCPPFFWVLLY